MTNVTDYPLLVLVVSFLLLWLAVQTGLVFLQKLSPLQQDGRESYRLIASATLTLLSLIIGFSFSLAASRYQQRTDAEAQEAGAIRTEYQRLDLLPVVEATRKRELLKRYLDQRVLFYITRDEGRLRAINSTTSELQTELWSGLDTAALAQPTSILALIISGMNDVLKSQANAQAAWGNRIPTSAWGLLATIAICCNLLVGYGARNIKAERVLLLILPLLVSISLFLIADIDSPRGGIIRLNPQNLESLVPYLRGR